MFEGQLELRDCMTLYNIASKRVTYATVLPFGFTEKAFSGIVLRNISVALL
jgi:hypothetical protein